MQTIIVRCSECKQKIDIEHDGFYIKAVNRGICPNCKKRVRFTPVKEEEEIQKSIRRIKSTMKWSKWASHFCNTCKNFCTPKQIKSGGDNNFSPVISLSNPIQSLAISSLACGALNAITRTEVTTTLDYICPFCQKKTLKAKEEKAFETLSKEEKDSFVFIQRLKEIKTNEKEKIRKEKSKKNDKTAFLIVFVVISSFSFISIFGFVYFVILMSSFVSLLLLLSSLWNFFSSVKENKKRKTNRIIKKRKVNKKSKIVFQNRICS